MICTADATMFVLICGQFWQIGVIPGWETAYMNVPQAWIDEATALLRVEPR